jgi:hypothetical protein
MCTLRAFFRKEYPFEYVSSCRHILRNERCNNILFVSSDNRRSCFYSKPCVEAYSTDSLTPNKECSIVNKWTLIRINISSQSGVADTWESSLHRDPARPVVIHLLMQLIRIVCYNSTTKQLQVLLEDTEKNTLIWECHITVCPFCSPPIPRDISPNARVSWPSTYSTQCADGRADPRGS